MRSPWLVLVVVAATVGCSSRDGAGSTSAGAERSTVVAPATTAVGTTTTEDPAPAIQRYASAVAHARSTLDISLCPSNAVCAAKFAAAWLDFSDEIADVGGASGAPDEIRPLVEDIEAEDVVIKPMIVDMQRCFVAQSPGDSLVTGGCGLEVGTLRKEGAAALDALSAWDPYLE